MIKIEIPASNFGEKSIKELHWEWFKGKFDRIHNKRKRDGILQHVLGISDTDLEPLITKPFDDKDFIRVNNIIMNRINAHKNNPNHKRWVKSIEKIFKYEDFINDKGSWNSYAYFKKMGINVCPYCNRSYTFTVDEQNPITANDKNNRTITKVTAPEIDHFFPQSDYPHLACSLYNFVPSCKICNHIKSNKIHGIINPYQDEFGKDGTFRIFCDESANLSKGKCDFKVKIRKTTPFSNDPTKKIYEEKKCRRIEESVNLFHLTKIYEEHQIEINDLFNRYRNYSQPKIKDILRLFHDDEIKKLGNTTELNTKQIDAVLTLYARKMKNLFLGLPLGAGDKQYPLRKFKEDIIEQLDNTRQKMKEEARTNK